MEWNFVWQTDGIHLLKPAIAAKYQERFKTFRWEFSKCACGYIEDRDLNAALNLRDAMTYEVA